MANDVFNRFPPFIREFIYREGWEQLREVQVASAEVIFNTKDNLLLSSRTASGKTEAAFFPILTELYETPSLSVGVLYISPLKSLINDQFYRMEGLLEESGISVTHWHGDVTQSEKSRLLQNPSGILQMTPESLEAMLLRRPNDLIRIFGDLRYVILDEVHTLTGSDRGNQILCLLSRLQRKIGKIPRRVGLSATVGDVGKMADWLGADTGRKTQCPVLSRGEIVWRLGVEHFFVGNTDLDQTKKPWEAPPVKEETEKDATNSDEKNTKNEQKKNEVTPYDAGYSYMYQSVYGKKALVFSNSREETEYLCATFRQIAERVGDEDVFLIHHGNLSASLREEAETAMKLEEKPLVTCATVTMELGVDIGRLERVLQNGSPNSVTSFLQRLGRSGRRGQPPEMVMVFREEDPLPNAPLPQLIPWELLKGISIIQLYMEEGFIEPPFLKKQPFSLLFHQTLSLLASDGEQTPKALAEKILSLPPFHEIDPADYRELLVAMLNHDFLELTEEGTLLVGLKGEKLQKSFRYFAVFKDSEDFTVRCGSNEIGTITTPPPVGDRFALAGRVWEVEELDMEHKLLFVKKVDGKMEISWPGDSGEVHTKILTRMKRLLETDELYPYLGKNAQQRLQNARNVARNSGMLSRMLVHLGGYSWVLFPWLGTRSFRTMRKLLLEVKEQFGISGIEYEGCYYISFRMMEENGEKLLEALRETAEQIRPLELVGTKETPLFDKYDAHIPVDLLRKAYAVDRLNLHEARERLRNN